MVYFAHDTMAAMLRLAFALKREPLTTDVVGWLDDETFFDLGVARRSPILIEDDRIVHSDHDTDPSHSEAFALAFLRNIDLRLTEGPALSKPLSDDAWQAVLDWRTTLTHIHARLIAPIAPAMRGIGDDPQALAAYKREVEHRFGQSLEELANDRYGAWEQLKNRGHLIGLGRHLATGRFYFGSEPSIADCLITADLYPLQLHDGVHLPIDLMYYLARVEDAAGIDLSADWLAR
ncbi:MAG: glutathione S-transferase [Thioalkalivibrionaceae bacterium]